MKKLFLLLALLPISTFAKDPVKITGLKMPESVIQAKDGNIYISEITSLAKMVMVKLAK